MFVRAPAATLRMICSYLLQYPLHTSAAWWHAALQGVLAVAQACGMQGLLKAAGIAYKVRTATVH